MLVHIGRRVPRAWFKNVASQIGGFVSFQSNIWLIIKNSMNLAKRKARSRNPMLKFLLTYDDEIEDLNYKIEWIKIRIEGTEEEEKSEYEDSLNLYKPFGKLFTKAMPKDEQMLKHFNSKILDQAKVSEAYEKGYGTVEDKNISNKLLEMGILTHVEWVKDFDERIP